MTDFWTLVGPDHAGKSTILERLGSAHGWHVVSYDDRYIAPFPLIRVLREHWVDDGFAQVGARHTAELVLAALHPIVLHLRDEAARAANRGPVIVDSYYYKLLAKCRLLGVEHVPLFAYWRSFPQPRGAVYLDVPPDVAWERSGFGARVNVFEHAGPAAADRRAGFSALQSGLRAAILDELSGVPVTIIDGAGDPGTVERKVLAALAIPDAR